jgi:hypothetical protein
MLHVERGKLQVRLDGAASADGQEQRDDRRHGDACRLVGHAI